MAEKLQGALSRISVGTENSLVELHCTEQGTGSPVAAGHRVITYDRWGFGESSQSWTGYEFDTFAADLDALLNALDLNDVALVGFTMGGGEVARYISKCGSNAVARFVLASAVPPYLLKPTKTPEGALEGGSW